MWNLLIENKEILILCRPDVLSFFLSILSVNEKISGII